ncbi:DUF2280 domain-containing protein [soil metagenome]
MATLSQDIKLFIVQALACYDSGTQVAAAVKQNFGLVVSLQQLQAYNPSTVAGARMSKKLRTLFNVTRTKFVEDVSTIPIANQAYRLRVLDRSLNLAEQRGNTAMVATLLEQAAKEAGGAFTNRRELTGKDGGPVQTQTETVQFYLPDNGR